MARMYPAKLPAEVSSNAEVLLFEQFSDKLASDYRVFHSVAWRKRDSGSSKADKRGEIDFVIAHPHYGLLLLEAKTGGLRIDGSGAWYSRDRDGLEHEITDPFKQVDNSLYALIDLLKNTPTTRRHHYRCVSGVALPHTIVDGAVALHAPREAVLDSSDLSDLEAAVKRLFGAPLEHELTLEAMEAVTDLLAPAREFVKIGLNARFEEVERQLLTLTERQAEVLDLLARTPQASIAGCAGSGKTLVAMEKARQLARAGQRVLFTCYNRHLANWVEHALPDGSYPSYLVKVRHFHGLADDAISAAGMKMFPNPNQADWENVPQRFEAALRVKPMKFDAIVADEGQDFTEEWWLLLMGELLAEDDSVFYVFYDPNQRIYQQRLQLPGDVPDFVLDKNIRNTRQIHAAVMAYYDGDVVPQSAGPDGLEVEQRREATLKGTQHALDELVNKQKIRPRDIIVLTVRAQDKSDLKDGQPLGNLTLTWGPPSHNQVEVSTVHAFKGLERSVVVLTEFDSLRGGDKERSDFLMYIGMSRAKHHLVLVGEEMPTPR